MKVKETWRLINQFDSMEVEVYNGRVTAINIGSLLSETSRTTNILTLEEIHHSINPKFRQKIMSMKGMQWEEFQKQLIVAGYTIWKQIKS